MPTVGPLPPPSISPLRRLVPPVGAGRRTSLLIAVAVAWIIAVPGAADAVGVTRLIESEHVWIGAGGICSSSPAREIEAT